MAKKVRGYRRHPIGMKQKVVARMEAGESPKALAKELGVNRTLLYVWKRNAASRPYGSDAWVLPSHPGGRGWGTPALPLTRDLLTGKEEGHEVKQLLTAWY